VISLSAVHDSREWIDETLREGEHAAFSARPKEIVIFVEKRILAR
jgi:hypothetical protein